MNATLNAELLLALAVLPSASTAATTARTTKAAPSASLFFLTGSSPWSQFAGGKNECIRPSGGVLGLGGKPLQDGLFGAPREGDPAVGAPPDVLALDRRPGLLVEDCTPHLGHLPGAEVLDELERGARVGHVVGDQHPEVAEVDEIGD